MKVISGPLQNVLAMDFFNKSFFMGNNEISCLTKWELMGSRFYQMGTQWDIV
jgi:hypothetical protein